MYLRKRKLEVLNSIQNLLTNFHRDEISPVHFFNFLIWYDVEPYAPNKPWEMYFIGETFFTWLFLKGFKVYWFFNHTNQGFSLAQISDGRVYNSQPYSPSFPLPLPDKNETKTRQTGVG